MVDIKEIMKDVKDREDELSDFDRCLNVLICPICGGRLNHMKLDWFSIEAFECVLCPFSLKLNRACQKKRNRDGN